MIAVHNQVYNYSVYPGFPLLLVSVSAFQIISFQRSSPSHCGPYWPHGKCKPEATAGGFSCVTGAQHSSSHWPLPCLSSTQMPGSTPQLLTEPGGQDSGILATFLIENLSEYRDRFRLHHVPGAPHMRPKAEKSSKNALWGGEAESMNSRTHSEVKHN